jgi:ABC-2 type transport system ATP-binding protein
VIHVEDLKKRYGDFEAVKGVSFDVAPGEVFGFLGPNGAGKTTTMRMIAGLLRPSSGKVQIGGHNLLEDPESAKRITGFIPDRPYLYEKLTAFEFLEFVGGLHRMENGDVAVRAKTLLATFGLERWADGLVENFSHGMKQRLVFAAALLPRPRLLVVDEPMVGLDPRGMKLVKKVFRDLCASKALTVFVSTHTLEVAEEVCDRIAIIHQGQIVALGTMAALREQAGKDGGRLEDIFLQLTEENIADAEPDIDVEHLLAPASAE